MEFPTDEWGRPATSRRRKKIIRLSNTTEMRGVTSLRCSGDKITTASTVVRLSLSRSEGCESSSTSEDRPHIAITRMTWYALHGVSTISIGRVAQIRAQLATLVSSGRLWTERTKSKPLQNYHKNCIKLKSTNEIRPASLVFSTSWIKTFVTLWHVLTCM